MPELPEVEVVRSGLEPAVTGAVITRVEVIDDRSLKRHRGPSEDFVHRLEGRSIAAAARRGKFMWLPLLAETSGDAQTEPREALVTHLGMSGQVLLRPGGAEDDRFTRIRVEIEHPVHGALRLNFADQRRFGSMAIDELVATPDGLAGGHGSPSPTVPRQAAHIARDPLDPGFDAAAFSTSLSRRSSGIKRVLLDQSVISGVGNIYADESLWAARIHHDQPASSLSRARVRTLLAEVRAVLERALAEGGTSFDTQYVNVNGEAGYFAHSLNAYGRQGLPCPRCRATMRRVSFMNRGSHFCPRCQRVR